MKSLKPVLFFMVVILFAVVVVQNSEVFMERKAMGLNLWVWSGETQPIPLSVYFLGFFLVGLLISYFYGLGERFRAKKTIQNHLQTIGKQEEEIKVLKSLPIAEEETPQEQSEAV
ncbi:MAG: LapA family protein [Thermodesulfobacteriota bacterium]|nr:LapA family protein [Thermodesulfobacteriota bacterium]